MKTLDPKIVNKLSKELGVSPKTVKNNVYLLASRHPNATPNALAQIYAQENNKSILRMLSDEDRKAFPSTTVRHIPLADQKTLRVLQIGKEPNRWYNDPRFQLLFAFLVVGIVAGTIAQVLGLFFAIKLHLITP